MARFSRLFCAILTHDNPNAGTGSQFVLMVNSNELEVVHHTFLDTSQIDLNRGQANLYSTKVDPGSLFGESDLSKTYFRVGLRGSDSWNLHRFFLWAEVEGIKAPRPLAMIDTSGDNILSTAASEGALSKPLRKVYPGDSNMLIKRLLVFIVTEAKDFAGTSSEVVLRITGSNESLVHFKVPDTSQLDLKRGQANYYNISPAMAFCKSEVETITLSIDGKDSWLPKRLFIFGLDTIDRDAHYAVPLVAIAKWSHGPLSTVASEGKKSVTLKLV